MIRPTIRQAYDFFKDGTLALAEIEHNGILVDRKYLEESIDSVGQQIKDYERRLKDTTFYETWRKRFRDPNLESVTQLGTLLESLGYKSKEKTPTGRPKWDERQIERVNEPFVKDFINCKKLRKVRGTYLKGIFRELDEKSYLHPSYNLAGGIDDEHKGGAMSYRGSSCIAKGTSIEVVRDVSLFPKGIPIEQVRKGDFVYCYDNNLNLTLKKVLWAGKTGYRKVVRLHWISGGNRRKGYVDLTPEHRVRKTNGKYVEARKLKKGFSVMALGRSKDRIYPTGKRGKLDHRFVYKKLVGPLSKKLVVHHKDHNHYNNDPSNLQAVTSAEHGGMHSTREGSIHLINASKFTMLRVLAEVGGRSALLRRKMDFTALRKKAKTLGINLKVVKDRYDGNGNYITRRKLKKACRRGISFIKTSFKVNLYKAWRMVDDRGFKVKRLTTKKQTIHRTWNNHKIIRIQYLKKKTDVYDLQVADVSNFIAGEVNVHNSAPNFQNMPIRNKLMGKLIRSCFIAPPGYWLGEIDFSTIEVRIAACVTKDSRLITYVKDKTKDMHRDTAMELFFLKEHEVDKKGPRDGAKNKFVFPQFYGSFYVDCARNIWEMMKRNKYKVKDSDELVRDRLRKHGITKLGRCDETQPPKPGTFEYRVKQVEDKFWNEWFVEYTAWKKTWFRKYLETGEVPMPTGFVARGVYRRNQVLNLPIQGPAFHCLLWSIIEIQKELRQRKMKSRIVGQIHDCMLPYIWKPETQKFLDLCKEVMTERLPEAWKWIIVPMETETDIVPNGLTWSDKAAWNKNKEGTWCPC